MSFFQSKDPKDFIPEKMGERGVKMSLSPFITFLIKRYQIRFLYQSKTKVYVCSEGRAPGVHGTSTRSQFSLTSLSVHTFWRWSPKYI